MYIKFVICGLSLLICQAFAVNDEKKEHKLALEHKDDTKKLEIPAFLKCFSNKKAFCYGVVSLAGLVNAGIYGFTAYDNLFGSQQANRNNLKINIISEISSCMLMGFIAHLAIKEISRC